MTILRLGWRNLWRNPRRSLITVCGLAFAFAFLIALAGFGRGLVVQLLRNGTELMVGHLQVHDGAYLPDRGLRDTLGGLAGTGWRGLLLRLRQHPRVRQAAPRVYGFALLSTGGRSSGAQLTGVEAEAERSLGRLFRADGAAVLAARNSLVLGEALALDLGVRPGEELAVVSPAADGTLGNQLFRVTGIIRTGLPFLDRSLALARLEDVQELLALPASRIHEIAVRLDDPMAASAVARELDLGGALPAGAQARGWGELLPQLSSYVGFIDALTVFITLVVVLFAAMGVLNTMLMASFERVREFGMLNALGMAPGSILGTVLAESLLLVLLGLAAGLGLAFVMMHFLTTRGMDLRWWTGELAMVNTRLDPVVKGVWPWNVIPWAAGCLALAAVAAAWWPARRATRMDPVQALRAPVLT